jgi:hypothetical protein
MISQALVMAIGVHSNPRGPIRSFTGKISGGEDKAKRSNFFKTGPRRLLPALQY